MKTRNRMLTGLGSIGGRSRDVALAAVMVCSAIVIHSVLVVVPSNSNATLIGGNDRSEMIVRLGQHNEPALFDAPDREVLPTIDRHETSLALITETAETPKPTSTEAESAKSSPVPRQEIPPPSPSRPSVPGRTAVANNAAPAEVSISVGKPAISALATVADAEPLPVTISALSDEDANALPDLTPPAPLAISATAR